MFKNKFLWTCFFSLTAISENDEICSNLSFDTEDNIQWNNMEVKTESVGENQIAIKIANSETRPFLKYAKKKIPTFKKLLEKNCTLIIGARTKVSF